MLPERSEISPSHSFCTDFVSSFRTILLIIPPVVIMDAMAGVIALIVLAYYSRIKCDPMVNGDISNLNMVRQLVRFAVRCDNIIAGDGFSGIWSIALGYIRLDGIVLKHVNRRSRISVIHLHVSYFISEPPVAKFSSKRGPMSRRRQSRVGQAGARRRASL